MRRRNDSSSVGTETAVVVQVAGPNAPSNSSSFRRRRRDSLASNRAAATSKRRAPTNCATRPAPTRRRPLEAARVRHCYKSSAPARRATDDALRRTRACETFASPLRELVPLLLRREDPAPVEIVVEQRRRQRVASQKCRLVLRDGIDRTTRDIEAFRTQNTAAPWLMRPTGTAT